MLEWALGVGAVWKVFAVLLVLEYTLRCRRWVPSDALVVFARRPIRANIAEVDRDARGRSRRLVGEFAVLGRAG